MGKVRYLSWQHWKNKARRSQIKPDRPKTKKTKDPDQVREKRQKTLLPKKSPPQVMNITPPPAADKCQKRETPTLEWLSLQLTGSHICRVYSYFDKKLSHWHRSHCCVWSVLESFLVTRLKASQEQAAQRPPGLGSPQST